MKQGTEWTGPGQGATRFQLHFARCGRVYSDPNCPHPWQDSDYLSEPTNLRLTGEPLTAKDLERIAHAK